MPYKLRKVPKKDLFWVVSKETGKKHSKEGLPKETAKAQMRALYAAETKGGELPTKKTSTLSTIARMGYKTGDELLKEVDGWTLNHMTPTLKFYRKGGDVIVGVRGSQTMSDWTDANRRILSNKLTDSARYKKDAEGVADYLQRSPGVVLYGAGHSLGGAILDELIKAGLVQEAVSFNPAVQPKFFEDKDLAEKHTRIYYEGDPVYLAMGRYTTGAELRKAEPGDWLAKYAIDFPKVPALDVATAKAALKLTSPSALATGLYASLKSHQLTPWLKDDTDVTMMKSLQKGIQEFRKEDMKGGRTRRVKGGAASMKGMPTSWTFEEWRYFIKYVDAVVFDTLSDKNAQTAVTIILTALGFAPQFQAALAAGLTFWEAAVAIAPLVTGAAAGTIAAPTITISALGISVSVGTAIAIFWALVYAHEYLYPMCSPEIVKAGKACNELRTKRVSEDLYKDVMMLKAEMEAEEKKQAGLRGGNRRNIILAGLTALATGVGAVNAWVAATAPDDWSRVFNSAASAVSFTAAGVLARLGNRRGEAPPLTAIAPQLQQGAQAILHSEALDRVVSLAALTEQGATDDPISLEPFNIGDRVVVLRSLRERGPVLSSQIMSEESWNNTLASGHVLNPSTRQPVTETYTTIIGAGIKSRADKVLRKEAKESGKKSEPSRDEYRAVLAEEALRVLQQKFRKVPFIPPPPPLLRRRRISEGSGDSATEAGSGLRGGRTDPNRPSRPSSPPPLEDGSQVIPPPLELEVDEGFPDVTSFQSVYGFLEYLDSTLEAQGLELSDMTPAFDELMEILLNYEEAIPEEEGEQITFLIQQIYAVAEPYLQNGGMRGGALPDFPDVAPPGSASEKRLYFQLVRNWLINIYANQVRPMLVRKLQLESSEPSSQEIWELTEKLQAIKEEVEEWRDENYYGTEKEWNHVYNEALVKAGVAERD